MGVEVIIIDHHEPRGNVVDRPDNVHTPAAESAEEFYEMVKGYLAESYGYVLADQDPDGCMAAAIYGLSKDDAPEVSCISGYINSETLEDLERKGVEKVLVLDYYGAYSKELPAEKVTILNPLFSDLPSSICTTHMVYESVREQMKNGSREAALTLAALGITSDYCAGSAQHIFKEVSERYPEYFQDLRKMIQQDALDDYSIFKTDFKELSEMVWAPCIFQGKEGSEEMIRKILENPSFSLGGMIRGSRNEAVKYMREEWENFREIVDAEWVFFGATAEEEFPFITYEPRDLELKAMVQKFSSMIADTYDEYITLVRVPLEDGQVKYSLRRRRFDIDLGAVLEDMGYAGGHPAAAGCTAEDPEEFEKEFKRKVQTIMLERLLEQDS